MADQIEPELLPLAADLREAIAAKERKARTALGDIWVPESDDPVPGDGVWVVEDGSVVKEQTPETIAACTWEDYEHTRCEPEYLEHIAENDPRSALRLCQSHREILDMYAEAGRMKKAFSPMRDLDHASAMGRLTTLGLVIQKLAEGYGLQAKEGDDGQ